MVLTKGGIWTSMEDEILKVAVMKFGENQWPRISVLLSSSFFQKSALQCKARWYKRLHPSIKKMEWTREEDEKLLHAVKINPGQWTTAGVVVGRNASECIERYERLVDEARPDHVNMEAYEVEMISEAWAFLGNTREKKGIEEGKRLASLQRRRELKAAGIDDGDEKRTMKGTIESRFLTTIEQLECEKRFDNEDRLRKEEDARNKARRQDVPSAIRQANKFIDQETVRERPKFNLPAHNIVDCQLKNIEKLWFGA